MRIPSVADVGFSTFDSSKDVFVRSNLYFSLRK